MNSSSYITTGPDRPRDKSNGFYDEVGGYHCEGVGYDPPGNWCGECCHDSCATCREYTKKEGT